MKISIFPYNKFFVYFPKNKDGDFTSTFKWTDDKLIIVVKCLQEFKNSVDSEIATQTLIT